MLQSTIKAVRFFSTSLKKEKKKFLVTGSSGQIGKALIPRLYEKFGEANVIATDVKEPTKKFAGKFHELDVTDMRKFEALVQENDVTYIVHLAAILSVLGEKNHLLAMRVNNAGVENALEIARKHDTQVFSPSTIAVFGEKAPSHNVPADTILIPRTVYGVTKVYSELLGKYYHDKFGVDYRSIRYPGIISSEKYDFNGTTDYSTQIFFEALEKKSYECYLSEHSFLPMMHIDDAIDATVKFMEADNTKLKRRTYNLAGMSFSPLELAKEVKKAMPEFKYSFKPDWRQKVADSWPKSIDDSASQEDWGWKYDKTLKHLVDKVLTDIVESNIKKKYDY